MIVQDKKNHFLCQAILKSKNHFIDFKSKNNEINVSFFSYSKAIFFFLEKCTTKAWTSTSM